MEIDLRAILAIIGTISATIFLLNLAPALIQCLHGNYTGATDIVINTYVFRKRRIARLQRNVSNIRNISANVS